MTETLELHFPDCLAEDFPEETPVAWAAVASVEKLLDGPLSDSLARHSPALAGNDWSNYLRCSIARMVHAARALRRAGALEGRLLDYGAYFGNFSLMFADLGCQVDAVDAFNAYGESLDRPASLMRTRGIRVLDFGEVGRDLSGLPPSSYDVVLCAGVIEHMPHSPRGLLASLNRILRPGGHLVLDTPNLAHLYKRQTLARGESVWPPLEAQFYSPIPYEGHHREYTAAEVAWMLHEVGHQVQSIELYNYSIYEQSALRDRDVTNFWKAVADPTLREYITTLSRRGELTTPVGVPADWRSLIVETEPHWQKRRPASSPPHRGGDIVESEPLLARLQAGIASRDQQIASRDQLLSDLRTEDANIRRAAVADVTERDRTIHQLNNRIVELNDELGALRGAFDATFGETCKRLWRRLVRRRRAS